MAVHVVVRERGKIKVKQMRSNVIIKMKFDLNHNRSYGGYWILLSLTITIPLTRYAPVHILTIKGFSSLELRRQGNISLR